MKGSSLREARGAREYLAASFLADDVENDVDENDDEDDVDGE